MTFERTISALRYLLLSLAILPAASLFAADDDCANDANFSESFGMEITSEVTPEIFKLVSELHAQTDCSWATALVLAEINPERKKEILSYGYSQCSPSVDNSTDDNRRMKTDEERLSARNTVNLLMSDDSFSLQLQKAKKEFSSIHNRILAEVVVPQTDNIQ